MSLRRGEPETTRPGLEQFPLQSFGSHEPLGRMSFAQENVAYFVRNDVS